MWNMVQRADFERARQQIEECRAEMRQRHAAELAEFDAGVAELAALSRLVDAFWEKYPKPAAPAPEAAAALAAIVEKAAPAAPVHKFPPEPRRADQREYGHTNFETFSRAVAKATF